MAKKLVLVGLIFMLTVIVVNTAYCDEILEKLGRGVCNVATSPYELIYQTSRVNNSDGPFAASTFGILKGFSMVLVRAAVGLYEVVTFPFPVPKNYEPILKDPEYFFEDQNW